MDKNHEEKPLLPPAPKGTTKRMWDMAETETPKKAEPELIEVLCDACGSTVRVRQGQRCPICTQPL